MALLAWSYNGIAEPERLAILSGNLAYPEIVTRLKHEMTLVCFHRQPRTGDPSYSRAVFCARVEPALFDLFFNSRTGYRGTYFDAPEVGLNANRLLLDELSPTLVEWAVKHQKDADRNWIVESLSLPSAKAWLAEETLSLCTKCLGEWSSSYVSELKIANARWEVSKHTHAAWGSQAPKLTKLRFFGAFVNAEHQEWVAKHKANRAAQIWEHGWS